jgi:hypothetical protein
LTRQRRRIFLLPRFQRLKIVLQIVEEAHSSLG